MSATPGLTDVWVTAETSDVRSSGGHCYMELLQKDNSGRAVAKSRAVIWAGTFARIGAAFYAATGCRLASDMKVMVRVSANFHAAYGFTLVISDIDPAYTVGDISRRRMEIVARLKAEGVFDINRSIPWPATPRRIAVVSARGAAGYGDFLKQLHLNPYRLRFHTRLFEAALQGDRTAPSIIAALENIVEQIDRFDCVVIIRGGGAGSDLTSFDDYDLAFHVAQFPLPVIVGIGHERDVTVLDYVANTRVKTPTAAAEALIARMADALARVRNLGRDILMAANERINGQQRQLAYYAGNLPALARNVLDRNARRIGPEVSTAISTAVRVALTRRADRLRALSELLCALSPEATLARGFSITRADGHAVTDASAVAPGTTLTTTLAHGTLSSVVK